MNNDNSYEFVPLNPVTHDFIPDEMKDFISSCGMMGIMPRRGLINPIHGIIGQVIDLRTVENGSEIEDALNDNVDIYNNETRYVSFREVNIKNEDKDSDENVEKVLNCIEENNEGIMKFLQANGMPYEKAKKFIKRVVRLSLRYSE